MIGILTALALFSATTALVWKEGKLTAPAFYFSLAVAGIFGTVTVIRIYHQSTSLVAAHALLAVVFIILAKNNMTLAFNHFIHKKPNMKNHTEEQKFEEYSNSLHNLQGKVSNGIPLTHEEKLLLEYYIEWIRSYKTKHTQARQKTLAKRH